MKFIQVKIFSAILLLFGLGLSNIVTPQIREFRIHDRGMLHETVFNTGEIGRGWMTGEAGNKTSVPVFEWPSRSATIVEGIEYSGQHNILGAGMYMAANFEGRTGMANRMYSLSLLPCFLHSNHDGSGLSWSRSASENGQVFPGYP